MLTKLINDDKGVTKLMMGVMLATCIAVAGLLVYTATDSDDEITVYSAGDDEIGTLLIKGSVIAQGDEVDFTVAIPEGAERINFTSPPHNVVVVSYEDDEQRVEDIPWRVANWGPTADGDNLLEFGENFRIAVETPELKAGTTFNIELKTPDGNVLDIERSMPDEVTPVVNLH